MLAAKLCPFALFIVLSACVGPAPIEPLSPSSKLEKNQGGVIVFASIDKTSPVGFYCELRIVDSAGKKFNFTVDKESQFRQLKLTPGHYWITQLVCATDTMVEIKPIPFEVQEGKVTIGPQLDLKVMAKTVSYTYGSPQAESLHHAMGSVGDNEFSFNVPDAVTNSVRLAARTVLVPPRLTAKGNPADIKKLDLSKGPDFELCNLPYYLGRPESGKRFAFSAECIRGKWVEFQKYSPEDNSSIESRRKKCIRDALNAWNPGNLTFSVSVDN